MTRVPGSVIVVHYAEIALKGGNRPWFETRLKDDLSERLSGLGGAKVRRERGRLVIGLEDAAESDLAEVLDRVARTPGVAWFAAAREVTPDLDALRVEVVARARASTGSFRVETKRSDKNFPLTSMEVDREVGAAVVEATGRKVDLEEADSVYGIEIANKRAFVFGDRLPGPGGLPIGTAGKVVALISGGIDSPVAAWRMMRRGCRVLGIHFLNASIGGEGVGEKLDLLGAALSRWQGRFTLRVVPFEALQRAIVAAVPADHRMLVYRRTMLRLADRVRDREGAKALVTGDSVGQVASQTLDNLSCVYAAVPPPILSPLCGAEKTEIIDRAKRIGTYEASILPHQDCCSFLIADHPATRASLREVEAMEKAVAWGTLLEEALQGTEVRVYPRDAGGAQGTVHRAQG
jgi:thiamine biosynthesis protein ThiI